MNEVKRIAPVDKKSVTLPLNDHDISRISSFNKDDKLNLSLIKNGPIKDEAEEKEKADRNMNSLINIGNISLKKRKY